jgi:hypothetical protein
MARTRNIKPGFFENEALAECDPLARLLFAGLWTRADREGRLEDRPRRIKAAILPYDDCDIELLLGQLADRQFIIRYMVMGRRCIQIANWERHQQPHVKETASTIPAPVPTSLDDSTLQAPDKHPASRSLTPHPESLNPNLDSEEQRVPAPAREKVPPQLKPQLKPVPKSKGPPGKKIEMTLPPDFELTLEMEQYAQKWAAKRQTDLDVTLLFEAFCSYYRGNGKRQVDWQQTWQTWVVRELKEYSGKHKGGNGNGANHSRRSDNKGEHNVKHFANLQAEIEALGVEHADLSSLLNPGAGRTR